VADLNYRLADPLPAGIETVDQLLEDHSALRVQSSVGLLTACLAYLARLVEEAQFATTNSAN
jgi:hypothetical protein